MNTVVKSLFTAVLVLTCLAPVFAAQSTFPDIQRILDNRKILVAIRAKDAPPMIMTGDDGSLSGREVELALDIGKKMGVPVEFVRTLGTYDEVVDIVARNKADLGVSFLSSDVRRAKKVYFSQPYVSQSGRIFYNRASFTKLKHDLNIKTIEELARTETASTLGVGVLEGSIYAGILERDMPRLSMKTYGSLPDLVTAVKEGEIFAGLHGSLQIQYYMHHNPETAIYVAVAPKDYLPSDICIAVRPDSPNLLRWVNIYLSGHVGLREVTDIVGGATMEK